MVYLLHLDRPYRHVRHFLTSAPSIDLSRGDRPTAEIIAGSGLLAAAFAVGINSTVARTWPGDEVTARTLRSLKGAPRLCPVCRPSSRKAASL